MKAEVKREHRERALLAVFPSTGPDSPLRKWVNAGGDLPMRSGSLTLQAAERVAQALAELEAATEARVRAELACPVPASDQAQTGYCAYGACVGPRERNGLCLRHWSPPPAKEGGSE